MNNLNKIIEKIFSDARSESESISDQTSSAIDSLKEATLKDAEALIEKYVSASEKECRSIISRAEGAAQMKKREIILGKKVSLINSVFDEAKSRILNLPTEEYCSFLANLIADAIASRLQQVAEMKEIYGEDEDNDYCTSFSVVFNERDKKEFSAVAVKQAKAILKKRMAIAVEKECADIAGGVIVRYGDIETNCSVEAVIVSAREKCVNEVTGLIFSPVEESAPERIKIIRRN